VYAPNTILALVCVGDERLAVVETNRLYKRFYVGKLFFGDVPSDAKDNQFFEQLENAKAELARLERASLS